MSQGVGRKRSFPPRPLEVAQVDDTNMHDQNPSNPEIKGCQEPICVNFRGEVQDSLAARTRRTDNGQISDLA
jgi:hypothetical protein